MWHETSTNCCRYFDLESREFENTDMLGQRNAIIPIRNPKIIIEFVIRFIKVLFKQNNDLNNN